MTEQFKPPVARLHRKWQSLRDSKTEEETDGDDGGARMRWLQHWFVSAGCFAHDCHGGLKWALLSYFSDKSCLRGAFVCIEAVRSSFSLLVKHLGHWIVQRLDFSDWSNIDAGALFMALYVDASWLHTFVELEIRFSDD